MPAATPMSRSALARFAAPLLASASAFLAGCGAGSEPLPVENVLLVTLDTTRADALLDEPSAATLAPRIAQLVAGGVRFPHAYSVAPLTLPAHASILTGLVPPRHGLRDNGHAALPGEADTLAERLGGQGFETAAFVSALVLDRGFALDQGFERYDQPALRTRTNDASSVERDAEATTGAFLAWLEERDDERPFFAWVHFYDAHVPYRPNAAHLERAGGDSYRGELAVLDDAVGVLLDALEERGLDASTLVVLTADHGESLGEHGEPAHGAYCYEATMRVPLVFRFPGAQPEPGPLRLASLVDLYPTVLGSLGFSIPEGLDGFDLFAPGVPFPRGVYFESYAGYLNYGWSPLAGWLDARGKYLASSDPEFYLAWQDPAEKQDLAASRQEECEAARDRIAELLERPSLEPVEDVVSDDLSSALDALGYARGDRAGGTHVPSPLEPSDLPSPRSRADELMPLLRANALFQAQRYGECLPLVEQIVRENPRHLLALDLYALCLMYAREFPEAEAVLRRRLALEEVADSRLNLGLCLLELDRPEEARLEIERANALVPGQPAIAEALQRVRHALGR